MGHQTGHLCDVLGGKKCEQSKFRRIDVQRMYGRIKKNGLGFRVRNSFVQARKKGEKIQVKS